jgi:hypothetical protein
MCAKLKFFGYATFWRNLNLGGDRSFSKYQPNNGQTQK